MKLKEIKVDYLTKVSIIISLLLCTVLLIINSLEESENSNYIILRDNKITLIDSLPVFIEGKTHQNKSYIDNEKNKLIIWFANDNCPNCEFNMIYNLNKFFQRISQINTNIEKLIYYCGNYNYVCKIVIPDLYFKYPIILDYDSSFMKFNKLPIYDTNTVLLNKNNEILLLGNFINDSALIIKTLIENEK